MRVAGEIHRRASRVCFGRTRVEDLDEIENLGDDDTNFSLAPQPQCRGDLIITTTTRVQACTSVARDLRDAALYRGGNVFI